MLPFLIPGSIMVNLTKFFRKVLYCIMPVKSWPHDPVSLITMPVLLLYNEIQVEKLNVSVTSLLLSLLLPMVIAAHS